MVLHSAVVQTHTRIYMHLLEIKLDNPDQARKKGFLNVEETSTSLARVLRGWPPYGQRSNPDHPLHLPLLSFKLLFCLASLSLLVCSRVLFG